jgi:uncharacterized protein (TIGR03435 family)
MNRTISALSLAVCLSPGVTAQSFEVASIRLHVEPVRTVGISFSGPRAIVSAMSLANLIEYAYDLKSYQISGGPAWAASARWDIAAKAEGDGILVREQARRMIQALLADRCQVKFHRERRELPAYLLVVAGKSAPKLKESAPDAVSLLRMDGNRSARITVTKGNMEQLVGELSGNLDRPVLDQTGLAGNYDYTLEWAPDYAAAEDTNAPSIFTALQEQLGLKLEPRKASIDVLVIDHAAKPSEN